MLVTVIATICIAGAEPACVDKIVTDQATLMQCGGAFAQPAIAKWMEENGYTARGYRLAKWGCAIGRKPVRA